MRYSNAYRYVSPFSANSYIRNPVVDSNEFYNHRSNSNREYLDHDINYPSFHTVTPSITTVNEANRFEPQETECSFNCLDCREGSCYKCQKGLFIYRNSCYESCPFDTFADNISLECKYKKDKPVFIKAYTISRCTNSCGKTFSDCSCNPRCKKSGDCCSDFQFCEIIEDSHTTESSIANCKFSSVDKSICLQCKDNFFYHNNNCISDCNENALVNNDNKMCIDRGNCKAPNCEKCDNNSSSNCKRCLNGYYLNEGQCLQSCPVGLRANRINFTCQSKSDFSFYWIFPSKYGCKDKCGDHNLHSDCSCRHTCLRRGNCCDDFEKECREELTKENCKLCEACINGKCAKCKENSDLSDDKHKCVCKNGFKYDIQEDLCSRENSSNEAGKINNSIETTPFKEEKNKNDKTIDDDDNYKDDDFKKSEKKTNVADYKDGEAKKVEKNETSDYKDDDIKKVEKNETYASVNKHHDFNKVENKTNPSDYKDDDLKKVEKNETSAFDYKEDIKKVENKTNDDVVDYKDVLAKKVDKNETSFDDFKDDDSNKVVKKETPDGELKDYQKDEKININETKLNLNPSNNKPDKYHSNESKFDSSIYEDKKQLDVREHNQTKPYTDNITKLIHEISLNHTDLIFSNPDNSNLKQKLADSFAKSNSYTPPLIKPDKLAISNTNKPAPPVTLNKQFINKLLSEQLLKSFKNVLSMRNPQNKNQILNLYMNGNISINVLTGNTNPQMITQNIFNNNSYNSHSNQVSNLGSQNKVMNVKSKQTIENKNKINEEVPAIENSNKLIPNLRRSGNSQLTPNMYTNHEQNFDENAKILKEFNIDDKEMELGSNDNNHEQIKNKNEEVKNKIVETNNKQEIKNKPQLINNKQEVKSKNEEVKSKKEEVKSKKEEVKTKHEEVKTKHLEIQSNHEDNKNKEEPNKKDSEIKNNYNKIKRDHHQLVKPESHINTHTEKANLTKSFPKIDEEFNMYKIITDNIHLYNLTRSLNYNNSVQGIDENGKLHIQNNYFIHDNSIKVMNSENPSIFTINRLNSTKGEEKEVIIINNNQVGNVTYLNGTASIIINNKKRLK